MRIWWTPLCFQWLYNIGRECVNNTTESGRVVQDYRKQSQTCQGMGYFFVYSFYESDYHSGFYQPLINVAKCNLG